MKHFLNHKMFAPNVLTIDVDPAIAQSFLRLAADPSPAAGLATVRPHWDSDIRWISAATPQMFERFEGAFEATGAAAHVEPYLDLDRQVRLFAGFLVIRSRCEKPNFHCDWALTDNEAFTLVTPVSDNATGFGMLYQKLHEEVGEYDYRPGEAIVFGDHFTHSTKPGRSDEPVILLSLSFGTDKMVHWDKIMRTAGYQSPLVRRPDGEFITLDVKSRPAGL